MDPESKFENNRPIWDNGVDILYTYRLFLPLGLNKTPLVRFQIHPGVFVLKMLEVFRLSRNEFINNPLKYSSESNFGLFSLLGRKQRKSLSRKRNQSEFKVLLLRDRFFFNSQIP